MYGKIQESGLIEINPLLCTLIIKGQYPVFLYPESPQGVPSCGLMTAASFVYWDDKWHFSSTAVSLWEGWFARSLLSGEEAAGQGWGKMWGSEYSASTSNLNSLLVLPATSIRVTLDKTAPLSLDLVLFLKVSFLPSVLSLPQKPN